MNFFAEHPLGLGIVDPIIKGEFRFGSSIEDGPAGETTGYFDNVLLRITTVNSQSVQFHQFAPVVFVKSSIAHRRQTGILAPAKLFGMRSEPFEGLRDRKSTRLNSSHT